MNDLRRYYIRTDGGLKFLAQAPYTTGIAHTAAKWLEIVNALDRQRDVKQISKAHSLPSQHIERVGIFIDGANLHAASRTLGLEVDYKALLSYFQQRSQLVRAYYYTALLETEEYSPLRPLVDWLGYNGYSVVTKPAKEFTDATGRRRVKGNMDIELAVDVLALAPHLDHVVLFSGDGDFRRLVEAVQQRGVRVTVISTIRTQPAMIADELRRQADAFLDLADLAEHIHRPHIEPRPRAASADSRPVPVRATPAEPFGATSDLPE